MKEKKPDSRSRLVLFDIDGTLVNGGGLWGRAFLDSIRETCPSLEIPELSFGGRTDHWILRECLKNLDLDESAYAVKAELILSRYLELAHARSRQESEPALRVLPGVTSLLESLRCHASQIDLTLLTGNIRAGADLKLRLAALDHHFDMDLGVYGSDHWDRYELPAIAVRRAHEKYGRKYIGKEIVIIGDTIHDVLCGRSLGVRTIAVGTGSRVSQAELKSHQPDYYFPDLGQTEDVLQAILEER